MNERPHSAAETGSHGPGRLPSVMSGLNSSEKPRAVVIFVEGKAKVKFLCRKVQNRQLVKEVFNF